MTDLERLIHAGRFMADMLAEQGKWIGDLIQIRLMVSTDAEEKDLLRELREKMLKSIDDQSAKMMTLL